MHTTNEKSGLFVLKIDYRQAPRLRAGLWNAPKTKNLAFCLRNLTTDRWRDDGERGAAADGGFVDGRVRRRRAARQRRRMRRLNAPPVAASHSRPVAPPPPPPPAAAGAEGHTPFALMKQTVRAADSEVLPSVPSVTSSFTAKGARGRSEASSRRCSTTSTEAPATTRAHHPGRHQPGELGDVAVAAR